MIIVPRFKKYFHAKRINADEYAKPIEKYGNYKKLTGYLDILRYGESIDKRYRLVGNAYTDHFTEGDLLYVDGIEPPNIETETFDGVGANAIVTSVEVNYRNVVVEFESIVEKRNVEIL